AVTTVPPVTRRSYIRSPFGLGACRSTSRRPGSSGGPGLGRLASSRRQLRDDDCDHERPAVEQLLDIALDAEELEADDPGLQEVGGDERAPGIEPSGLQRGSTQEGGCERG